MEHKVPDIIAPKDQFGHICKVISLFWPLSSPPILYFVTVCVLHDDDDSQLILLLLCVAPLHGHTVSFGGLWWTPNGQRRLSEGERGGHSMSQHGREGGNKEGGIDSYICTGRARNNATLFSCALLNSPLFETIQTAASVLKLLNCKIFKTII